MNIVVQKFGGTSLESKRTRKHVVYHIQEALNKKNKVIVVVSALGKHPAPYATDSLLKLVNYPQTNASDRELDLLLSCGEVISAVVVANELKAKGIAAVAFTGEQAGITTTDYHMKARIKQVDTRHLLDTFHTHDVVVVAGFQGKTEQGNVTTLGRGGSDTTATALAIATKANKAEIFTDVDGIMTADPKIVTKAKVLAYCTYTETCNLAYQGAQVIHPQAVELAMQAELPLHIRSTYKRFNGTFIANQQNPTKNTPITEKPITGIAHLSGISQVKINKKDNPDFSMSEVFKTLAEAGISIDFINMSPNQLVFTLPNSLLNHAKQIFIKSEIHAAIYENCAKVSAVGAGMAGMPGVAAKVVSALAKKGIEILQAADSSTTIWVLVHEKHLRGAVNALHDTFKLNESIPTHKKGLVR